MLPPIRVIDRHVTPAGGETSHTFTLGTLVTDWDTDAGVVSRHLVFIVNAKSPDAVNARDLLVRLNADAGPNYNTERINGIGAGKAATRATGAVQFSLDDSIPGTNFANAFGGGYLIFPHAFNATNHKGMLAALGAAEYSVLAVAGRWANVAPITSIFLSPNAGNFAADSEFILAVVDERFLIEEVLLGGDADITFADIPQGDGDLSIVGYLRADAGGTVDNVGYAINDDAVAANYAAQRLYGNGAVLVGDVVTNAIALAPGNGSTANAFGSAVLCFSQYAKANHPHVVSMSGFHEGNGPSTFVGIENGRRKNAAAITKLFLAPLGGGNQFKAGTLMSLYYMPSRRELIKRVELVVDQATITFDNLDDFDSDFEALVLQEYLRSDVAALTDEVDVTINDDEVAADYDTQVLNAAGAVTTAARSAANKATWGGYIPGDTEGAGEFGGGQIALPAYSRTDGHKHALSVTGRNETFVAIQSQRWESLAAIRKIVLAPNNGTNFKAGSYAELWGVVPLDTIIHRRTDQARQSVFLRPIGKVWRH